VSRCARALLVGGLALGPALVGAPAHAATDVELVVDASAWSWRRLAPAPVPEPSNVPPGSLAVAFDGQPGTAAKATYLRLALGDLPTGTTLSRLVLTVPVDTEASDDPTAAPVVACRLAADFPTGEGVDPATAPEEDCTDAPVAEFDAEASALRVDLSALGRAWLAGAANTGVVLRPPVDVAVPDVLPYQLVLAGPAEVTGLATVELPGPLVAPPPAEPVAPPAFEAPVDGGVAFPPVMPGTVLPPGAPAAPLPVAVPGAPAAPQPQALVPAARPRPLAATGASVSGLGAAVLGGVLLLLVAGWSLGDTTGLRSFARAERARSDRLRVGALVLPAPVAAAQPRSRRQTRQGRRPLASAVSTLT
jgi:hypothetical protein